MIHVENRHWNEIRHATQATSWAASLVFRWLGGDPLSDEQQRVMADYCTGSVDTGIQALDIEADQDIPYLRLNLDIETTPSDATPLNEGDEDMDVSDAAAEALPKEAALAKGIVAALGGFTRLDIPLELLSLEDARVVAVGQLERDRQANPDRQLFADDERYEAMELAHQVFRDEQEIFEFCLSLATPKS